MTTLIRIGSKIFNPRHIIMCEPVTMWVYDEPGDDGRQIEALRISLVGRRAFVISPEEWQGVKEELDIVVVEAKPLPEKPAPALSDDLPF